jgi:hypothetical protein
VEGYVSLATFNVQDNASAALAKIGANASALGPRLMNAMRATANMGNKAASAVQGLSGSVLGLATRCRQLTFFK